MHNDVHTATHLHNSSLSDLALAPRDLLRILHVVELLVVVKVVERLMRLRRTQDVVLREPVSRDVTHRTMAWRTDLEMPLDVVKLVLGVSAGWDREDLVKLIPPVSY